MRDGDAREQLDGRVVVDVAVCAEHAAGPVVGVLAQADVGDHRQLGCACADRAHAALHDAVVVPGARAVGVLAVGKTEQQHAGAACLGDAERLLGEQVGGQVALAGEARDRAVDPLALDDEQGLHEVGRVEARLADDPADRLAAAQSSEARGRKGHQSPHGTGAPARLVAKGSAGFCRR